MSREHELGQALNKLITQTEAALEEGWIHTEKFKKHLNDARKAVVEEKEKKDLSYPKAAPGF